MAVPHPIEKLIREYGVACADAAWHGSGDAHRRAAEKRDELVREIEAALSRMQR